jgi:hypothetical protein
MGLIAASCALALGAGGYAMAQQGPGAGPGAQGGPGGPSGQGPRTERAERQGPSREDVAAFAEARIAGIKAGLKLTPEQEKLWPPVEQAIRKISDTRIQRREMMRNATPPADFMERIDRMATMSTQGSENMRGLADAMKPLWATLDERQKRLLPQLARPSRQEMGGMYAGKRGDGHHRWGRGDDHGQGYHHGYHHGRGEGRGEGRGGPRPAQP